MKCRLVKNGAWLILAIGFNAHAFDLFGMQQILQEKIQAAKAANGLPLSGSYQTPPQVQPMQTQNAPVIAQEELSSKINSLGKSNGFTMFTQKKEGFTVNQKNYMDPEGKVVKYGFDGVTGMVSYLAEITPGQYVIKTMQAQSSLEPVVIANARYIGGTWEVMTVTGKRLTGQAIVMGSRGFTLNRDNGAIIFDPISGMKTASIPDGYAIADFQNGDATQTKFVLLEAIPAENDNGKLMGTFKSLGSSFGLTKKEDYGLMNLDTGKLSMFNISSESKNRSECIQKQRINSFVNKCEKSVSFESLYDQFGMPNVGHYYWRVTWMKTPSQKNIAVTIEDGVKRLIATDLTTGKRVLLKERMMGINQFKVKQDGAGKISVDVKLGFNDETIEDVEKQLETLPAIEA
jgi:hypothetical protein